MDGLEEWIVGGDAPSSLPPITATLGDHFIWGKLPFSASRARFPSSFGQACPSREHLGAMVELIVCPPSPTWRACELGHLWALPRPLLGHPERMGRRGYAYSVVTGAQRVRIGNQNWRYGNGLTASYNLRNDPREKNNLARKGVSRTSSGNSEILADKQKLLKKRLTIRIHLQSNN